MSAKVLEGFILKQISSQVFENTEQRHSYIKNLLAILLSTAVLVEPSTTSFTIESIDEKTVESTLKSYLDSSIEGRNSNNRNNSFIYSNWCRLYFLQNHFRRE